MGACYSDTINCGPKDIPFTLYRIEAFMCSYPFKCNMAYISDMWFLMFFRSILFLANQSTSYESDKRSVFDLYSAMFSALRSDMSPEW